MTKTEIVQKMAECAGLSHPEDSNIYGTMGAPKDELTRFLEWMKRDESPKRGFLWSPRKLTKEDKVEWLRAFTGLPVHPKTKKAGSNFLSWLCDATVCAVRHRRSQLGSHEKLSLLRALLLRAPSLNAWWEIVDFVTYAGADKPLLQEYLSAHIDSTPAWRRCTVANGDWLQDDPRHALCAVTKVAVPSLPGGEMVYCPPGEIERGTKREGFWALTTPVTQDMFEAVMGHNPSRFKGGQKPAERISYALAIDFCNRLSELEGLEQAYSTEETRPGQDRGWVENPPIPGANGYRLPTPWEWEYLCRAGNSETSYDSHYRVSWNVHNSGNTTQPVSQKRPNAWELYDTLGNVWEWCEPDREDCDPDMAPARGGSWINNPSYLPEYSSQWIGESKSNVGLRVVRGPRER